MKVTTIIGNTRIEFDKERTPSMIVENYNNTESAFTKIGEKGDVVSVIDPNFPKESFDFHRKMVLTAKQIKNMNLKQKVDKAIKLANS